MFLGPIKVIKRMLYLKFAINELIACLLLGHRLLGDETVMFKLKKHDNNLAYALDTALQTRQEFLSRNEAFLAAVWVSSVC